MRCEFCDGTGFWSMNPVEVCANCNGCGVAHCCDNIVADPDITQKEDYRRMTYFGLPVDETENGGAEK